MADILSRGNLFDPVLVTDLFDKVKGKSAVISGFKKGKTYYIRVRGFKTDVHGNNYYTPYSKMRKVTITK